ncbi:hypothetical protein L4C37_12805 [Vibrio kagoshimensis]|uniref:Flagellar biosynthesis protein FlgE n=1 Tax=Vibrio gallaecicus TaxID=552386 RepID=A0ABV4N8U6_9VIBR
MSISGIQSGYQMIQQSSQMAEEAAVEINQASQREAQLNNPQQNDLAFNQVEAPQPNQVTEAKPSEPIPSHSDAMMKLTQSSNYNRIGASVVERNNEMIGSLLDIHI